MTETRKFVALSNVCISENSLGSKFYGACFNLGWMQKSFQRVDSSGHTKDE